MTICIKGIEFVKPSELVYARPAAIDAVVRTVVADMVEASIDMICDGGQQEYPTKRDIEACLSGANTMAIDFINDAFDEVKAAIIKQLEQVQVKANVTAIKFDNTDYSDIVVDIEIE